MHGHYSGMIKNLPKKLNTMVGGQIQPQNRCLHLFCNMGINTQTAVHAYLPHGCCQPSSSRENFNHVKIVDGPARNPLKKFFLKNCICIKFVANSSVCSCPY
jgi:hypothetical protein